MKKNTLLILAILLPLLITGCGLSPQGNLIRGTIKQHGETAADASLQNAEWALCNAVTAGAVRRAYGSNPVKAQAYRSFCNSHATENVILPPIPSKADSSKVVEATGALFVPVADPIEKVSQ